MGKCCKCEMHLSPRYFDINKNSKGVYVVDKVCYICLHKAGQKEKSNMILEYENHKMPIYQLQNLYRQKTIVNFNRDYKRFDPGILLGIDFNSFKDYIESKFKSGMTFQNRGVGDGCWQLDHIIPVCAAETEEHCLKISHYTNFQPLWYGEHVKKGVNIMPEYKILI